VGTLHFKFFATFLQRSWITFFERSKLLSLLLGISKHTSDRKSAEALTRTWEHFIERSNNVVSERSLWTFIERPRERCGNVALQVFLQYSYNVRR